MSRPNDFIFLFLLFGQIPTIYIFVIEPWKSFLKFTVLR